MRVSLDATPLLGTRTGIAAFTGGLLASLGSQDDLEVSAFCLSARGWRRLDDVLPPGVRAIRRPLPASILTRSWARGSRPTFSTIAGRHDVVHGTNFVAPPNPGGAEVVTVYDLTAVLAPHLVAPSSLRYPALVRAAIDRGAFVHVTAETVRGEVIEHLGAPVDRVRVVASGPPRLVAGDATRGRWVAGGGDYVLALGTVEPRKGLVDLVAAFERLVTAGVRLVVAGPDGWGTDALVAAIDGSPARNRIVRLGWVDDRDRADLLAGASVVCMPSRNEGFGYPPLEAMAAGVPVVASTAGSLPDVIGDAGILVEPGAVDALAAAIDTVLTDEPTRERLVDAGRRRLDTFSWEACAQALAGLYHDARSAKS